MTKPSPEQRAKWRQRAALKRAIVPEYFEVFPHKVIIVCGSCRTEFVRNIVNNVNEPVYVCPHEECRERNWVPIYFNPELC